MLKLLLRRLVCMAITDVFGRPYTFDLTAGNVSDAKAAGLLLDRKNAIRRLKDFRRVATRYDNLARSFLSAVAILIAFWDM